MTVAERLAAARRVLEAAGIPPAEARLDAELFARTALGWDRATFFVNLRKPMDPAAEPRLAALLERRARREPAAYILGVQEFWGIDFEVTPAVLIPRPETELIVEEALALYGYAEPPAKIADVCTGSGCLAVVLAREFNGATVIATDISPPALHIARRNTVRHSVAARVTVLATDLLDSVPGTFDLIVSNPPYVGLGDRANLQPEVRDNEPEVALFAGHDGLEVYRRLLPQARAHLAARGHLILEIGLGQRDGVIAFAEENGFRLDHTRRDLQNITRTLVLALE
jgi:release factor glutamine methyltransferase